MQRIQNQPTSIIGRKLKYLFLSESTNPPAMEICLLYIEIIGFIVVVCEPLFMPREAVDPGKLQGLLIEYNWITYKGAQASLAVSLFWIEAMLTLLIIRALVGVTLIRALYIPCLVYILSQQISSPFMVITLILLFLNIIIDILSHIEFEFNTKNVYSQTHHYNKLLHYPCLMGSIFLHITFLPTSNLLPSNLSVYVVASVSIGLVIMTFVSLLPSTPISNAYSFIATKPTLIRFYMVCICYFVMEIVNMNLNLGNGWLRIAILLVFQALIETISRRLKNVKIKSEISNGNIIGMFFRILCYMYAEGYDEESELILKEFLSKEEEAEPINISNANNNENGYGQAQKRASNMNTMFSVFTAQISKNKPDNQIVEYFDKFNNENVEKKRGLYQQLCDGSQTKYEVAQEIEKIIMDRGNEKETQNRGFIDRISRKILDPNRAMMILAQIKFWIYGDLVGAMTIIEQIKLETSCFSWISRLCLYKFQQKLYMNLQLRYNLSLVENYSQFFLNEQFRSLLLKSSYEHLSLWSYISSPSISFAKMSVLLGQVLKSQVKVDKFYQSGHIEKRNNQIHVNDRVWCETLVLMYVDYIYMVRRDVEKAKSIYRKYEVGVENRYWGNVSNRIYMCILLDEEALLGKIRILNISLNVKKLLGYSRSSLKSSLITSLLPNFFTDTHDKLVQQLISPSTNGPVNGFYSFSKQVMIKHNDGYYLPVRAELKLVADWEGTLKIEGYIQLLQKIHNKDYMYNWSNYFFVRVDNDELVEVGPALREIIQLRPRKFTSCSDYFESNQQISCNNIEESNNKPGFQKYFNHNGVEYTYHLLQVFPCPETHYHYYCLNDNGGKEEMKPATSMGDQAINNFQNFLLDYLKHQKYPTKYEDCETNIEQYLEEKKKIRSLFVSKSNVIILIVVIFVFICAISLEGLLVSRLYEANANKEGIKNGMLEIIDFYHSIGALGMHMERQRFITNFNNIYNYGYFSVKDLCLSLQSTDELIKDYDTMNATTYQTQPFNRSLSSLAIQLVSAFYSNLYITDAQLQTLSAASMNQIFPYLWQLTITDPLPKFFATATQILSEDNRIKIGIEITVCLLIVVSYILVLCLDVRIRQYEYETLKIIGSLNSSKIFCNSISDFLRRTVGGIINKDFDQMEAKQKQNELQVDKKGKMELISSISARQNSIRNLYGASPASTSRQYPYDDDVAQTSGNRDHQNLSIPFNTIEMKEKKENDEEERKQLKIRPQSKAMLAIWTIGLLVIIGVTLGFLLYEQTSNQVSLVKGVQNLLLILNKKITFSSMLISYLHSVSSRDNKQVAIDMLKAHYKKYNDNNAEAIFQEVKYSDFVEFARMYQNVNYVYLCEYMYCQDKYKKDVNIIYNSAVHRFMESMYVSAGLPPNQSDIQLLFYAHYLLQETQNILLKSYLTDFSHFEVKKYEQSAYIYASQFIMLGIYLTLALSYYICHFLKEKLKYQRFLDLVKEDSYDITERQ